jgi:hypothetical protein
MNKPIDGNDKSHKSEDASNTEHSSSPAPSKGQLTKHDAIDNESSRNKGQSKPAEVKMGFVRRWWHFVRDPQHSGAVVAIFTIVIAITGIAYTSFAFLQWQTMHDTLSLERPWLGPTQRRPVLVDAKTGQIQAVYWNIRNGGRSPAINVHYNMVLMIGPILDFNQLDRNKYPKVTPCENRLTGEQGNVLVPNSEIGIRVAILPEVRARLSSVYSSTVGLYLVGCIDYSDTTKQARFRTNVLEYFDPSPPGNLITPNMGNDAY